MKTRILMVMVFSCLFAGNSFGADDWYVIKDSGGTTDQSIMYDDGDQVCVDYNITTPGQACPASDLVKFAINGYFSSTGFSAYLDENATYSSVYGGTDSSCSQQPYPSDCNAVTVAGGRSNRAADYSFVGGGYSNHCDPVYGVVGGGSSNHINGRADYSAIVGGYANTIGYEQNFGLENRFSIIGGGYGNSINSDNTYSSDYSVIAGGKDNLIDGTSPYSVVSGGRYNVAAEDYASVGGGYHNIASDNYATVCGGYSNVASGIGSTAWGYNNDATGDYSTVGGAACNATGTGSTAIGYYTTASGAYSIALGLNAYATHAGSVVISSGTGGACNSGDSEELRVCMDNAVFTGDIWADDYHEFSPYPPDLETAYDAVFSMQSLPDGEYDPDDTSKQLDHEKLHPFIYRENEDGRAAASIGAIISAQNEVIKDLAARNILLEARIAQIERVLGVQ
ncbi:MAG: hypothetical protein KAH38_03235 [Candidatus Hydrogenedentes bacterium]|nr:hypothetical protein [Candidatus Hydrogenedentota bacterium]